MEPMTTTSRLRLRPTDCMGAAAATTTAGPMAAQVRGARGFEAPRVQLCSGQRQGRCKCRHGDGRRLTGLVQDPS
jgi:hypothetical protein